VAISDPSWENHRALFEAAGFNVSNYTYYDAATRGVNVTGLLQSLRSLPSQTIVVLHACCHNPTGADLSPADWDQVIQVLNEKQHIPFLDMAYQGFGDGIAEDALSLNKLAATDRPFLVSSSFSKSFSLYGERVGALSVVTSSAEEAVRVLSQVKRTIRTNYSNPPTHGGAVVAAVLSTPELRQGWEQELAEMRERIKAMRHGLAQGLKAEGAKVDFSFVTEQRGMFSYTGLTEAQVTRLREEFAVYAINTGRVCIAALNSQNLPRVCRAIAAVVAD
jgi:aromatic-amino-acid transaminase